MYFTGIDIRANFVCGITITGQDKGCYRIREVTLLAFANILAHFRGDTFHTNCELKVDSNAFPFAIRHLSNAAGATEASANCLWT